MGGGRISRHRGSNFLVAFRVLSEDRRAALSAVYAFCRLADDAVDESRDHGEASEALARMRRSLDDAFAGKPGAGIPTGLAEAIRGFDLPAGPFHDLLEGVGWDLEGRRYADAPALREYCRRVASAVGLLCVRIFGCEDPGCVRYAENLGVALQWTNILRDVGVDLSRGRLYLPADALRRHDLTLEALQHPDAPARERLGALIREQSALARAFFGAAEAWLPPGERRRALAGEIMAAVYRTLLRRVERVGARVLDREVRVRAAERAWIAARLLVRERLRFTAMGST